MKIYNNTYVHSANNLFLSNTNFKGEFDKYAFISQKIVNARIAKERSWHENNINHYNTQISHADRKLSSLKGLIKSLKKQINENDSALESLRADGNEIIKEVHNKKEIVKNLSENNPKLIQQYYRTKDDIQKDINKKTTNAILVMTNDTNKLCNSMEMGLKNQLIKKVINPILQFKDNIPSSIYIENTSGTNNLGDKIATWLCDMANANYERIDANSVQTTAIFINNLKKLLLSAYRNFEEHGHWTMIFVDNIHSIDSKISPNLLNKILKSCSNFYHSTIIAMSNSPMESVVPKLSFMDYLKLDKTFVQDSNVGLMSIAKDLIKKKI